MALREILHFPDPRLRDVAKTVEHIDDEIQTLLDDMVETMYDAQGVGLAATQIGIALRIAVIDVTQDKSQQLYLINPEILETANPVMLQEGCLSVPGEYDTVPRFNWVKMRAMDRYRLAASAQTREIEPRCVLRKFVREST